MYSELQNSRPIAIVEGVTILLSQIQEEAERIRAGTSTEENLYPRALENLIDSILLSKEADRLCLSRQPGCDNRSTHSEHETSVSLPSRTYAGEQLLAHWLRDVKPPGKPERKAFYQNYAEQFHREETIRATHLVSRDEATTERMRQRVLAGEDCSIVAREHSDCPESGGDLGYFARGVMVEEFDNAVFDASVSCWTPVFQTQFGFHTAMVVDRKPARIESFSEADAEITRTLLLLKQDRVAGERMNELRRRAVIQRIS